MNSLPATQDTFTQDTLLLITTSYPRSGDGSEAAGSFMADLAMELAHRVPVRILAPGNAASMENAAPNVSVWRFPAPQGGLSNLRLGNPLDVLRIFAVLRSGRRAAMRATQDGRVKHAMACWALPSGAWANRLLRKRRIPYSIWVLGSDVWSLGRVPIIRRVLAFVMRAASHRYADGLKLAQDSKQICGRPVEFLPTTRKLETTDPPPPAVVPPYNLVFIGRWHPNKGIDLLLDALMMLDDADWKRIDRVAIYGGGPMQNLVHAKSKALVFAGRPLDVGGFIPKLQAEQAIMRADYLIIPSRIESIPVVFSDAMKLGRPVIATPVGDLPKLLGQSEECGILAASVDADGIANALRKALATKPDTFANGVRRQAANFDLSRIADRIVNEVMGN
ncbi:MAG: glycosyltransferase [Rudaea sp.]|uniref:glycosyltransferase n=1 Tax=Rudaea sp. TaxID=2136325 RepID=UPI0039E5808D